MTRYARPGYRYRKPGYSGSNTYARTMGLVPIPYRGKRKYAPPPGAQPRLGRRVRPRMGRSFTKTRTRTKTKRGGVTSHGDNSSSSYNMIGGGWRSRTMRTINKKLICPQTVNEHTCETATCLLGLQNVKVFPIMTKTMLNSIKSTVAGGTTNNNAKMVLRNGKQIFRFRNCSNTNARCTIYDIVTKRDIGDIGGSTTNDPQIAWRKGLTDAGGATNGQLKVGCTPHRSPEFNHYFAINKVTSVNLEPGQEHQHTIKHKWNKIVNSVRFENTNYEGVAGLTRYIMLVWHGTLVHGADDQVSYASIKLDFGLQYDYTFGWLEKQLPSYTQAVLPATALTAPISFMAETGDAGANVMAD